eukprot:616896-Hanusia_phi.AAC.1
MSGAPGTGARRDSPPGEISHGVSSEGSLSSGPGLSYRTEPFKKRNSCRGAGLRREKRKSQPCHVSQ